MIQEQEKYALSVVVPGLPKILHYKNNKEIKECSSGHEVLVEVSRSKRKGWVLEKKPLNEIDSKIKLKDVLKSEAVFPASLIPLFNWMSEYYGVPIADVIDNAIPKKTNPQKQTFISLSRDFLEEEIEKLTRAPLQKRILEELIKKNKSLKLEEFKKLGTSYSQAIKSLEEKGFIKREKREVRERGKERIPPTNKILLNGEQEKALEIIESEINKEHFSPILLHGVTGSGKTEVYLRAIVEVLKKGQSALIVVPEIALTPQLINRFEEGLSSKIAVLHSMLSQKKRWAYWKSLLSGEVKLALGARSSIFAPLDNLGLIVIDEEHDSSYKQSDGFRYNARDVAVMRAKLAGCPIILGSATPSFESLNNANKNRYKLVELKKRVKDLPAPKVELVDLRKIKRKEMSSKNISPRLFSAIKETIENNSQCILFYNRRGFSSYLQCGDCGETINCPNCSVTFTYHQRKNELVCHYCGVKEQAARFCKSCHDPKTTRIEKEKNEKLAGELEHRGAGTERVEEELSQLFPDSRILRMDRDVTSSLESYQEILDAMRERRADILVGTQMIAKGHDLPGVKLVGIIDADVGLHFPDFRASEKTFQLLLQASGRAGRDKEEGLVILQTREPNHPSILATHQNRFSDFTKYELKYREALNYPPFSKLLRLIVSSTDIQDAFSASELLKDAILEIVERKKQDGFKLSVLGPAPAPLHKIQNRYRYHFLIKASSSSVISSLAKTLYAWKKNVKGVKDFRLNIDVDPVDML